MKITTLIAVSLLAVAAVSVRAGTAEENWEPTAFNVMAKLAQPTPRWGRN